MGVQDYYDVIVKELEEYEKTQLVQLSYDMRLQKILKYLSVAPSNIVLDVGGGSGRYTIGMAEKGYQLTINDISTRSLELAREKLTTLGFEGQVTIKPGDIMKLDFPENSFGGVICEGSIFSYLQQPEKFLTKIEGWLQPGGIIILTASSLYGVLVARSAVVQSLNIDSENKPRFDYIWTKFQQQEFLESREYDVTFKGYSVNQLRYLIEKNNFQVLELYGRNVWNLFFSQDELSQILTEQGKEELKRFEISLHQVESIADFCHSIAMVAKKI